MIVLQLRDSRDAARIVEALLAQGTAQAQARPMLARRYVEIADSVGDALDRSGLPPCNRTDDPLDQPAATRRRTR